jgi:hypothetical protein
MGIQIIIELLVVTLKQARVVVIKYKIQILSFGRLRTSWLMLLRMTSYI